MDQQEFDEYVQSIGRTDYVDSEVTQFIADTFEFNVIERSALKKSEEEQTEIISISTTKSELSEKYVTQEVKNRLNAGVPDAQGYQLQKEDGTVPDTVEIWIHGSGYSAFLK